MAWSKVKKPFNKPIGWWKHKILCEFGYWKEQKFNSIQGMGEYYYHLQQMCEKYGYNLYGERIIP